MQPEILQLQKRLANLPIQRAGFAVCIVGELGLGKSYTLTQLAQALPSAHQKVHAAQNLSTIIAQLPRPKRLPAWLGRTIEQNKNLATLLGLLEANAPFTLFIEDLDSENCKIWLELAARLQGCPKVGLVLTSRQTFSELETITLRPLEPNQTTALLERELGAVLPADASVWIEQQVRGNPLFALEYLRFLARMGFLWNDGLRWHWREPPSATMPTQIEALLEERLLGANLGASEELLLYGSAYLQSRMPEQNLLPEITQLVAADLHKSITTLQHLGVLDQQCQFTHPLLQRVAFAQGQTLHQQFARRAIAALDDAPDVAVQLLDDAALEPSQNAAFWRSSAAKLAQQPQLAAQHKYNAAQFLTGKAQSDLLLEVLEVIGLGEPQKALQISQTLLQNPELAPEDQARVVYSHCFGVASTTRNLASVRESLKRLSATEQQSARYVFNLLGYCMVCGHPQQALELWEQHPELHNQADFIVQTHVLSAWVGTGQFAPILERTAHLLNSELPERQRMNLLNIRAIALAQTGQLEQADACQLSAIEIAKQTGQHNAIGTLLFNRAMTFERRNNRQAMQQHASKALAALTLAGNMPMAAQATIMLANYEFEQADYSVAFERLEQAYSSLKFEVLSPLLVTLELTLSHLHRERRLPYSRSLAQKFAREALAHATTLQQPKLLAAAQAQVVLSATQPSAELAQEALNVLKTQPEAASVYAFAAYAYALESAQAERTIQAWQEASNHAEQLGFTLDAQLFKLEQARFSGNQAEAKSIYNWFTERHLLHGANVAKLYFPDLEQQTSNPKLELLVLSTMRLGGKAVKGQKRQELVLALLEARVLGQNEISGLALLDRLYPNQTESEAQVALRQLIFKTRNAHSPSLIQTTQHGYALGDVKSDLEQFLQQPDLTLWQTPYPSFGSPEVRDTLHQTALQHTKFEQPSEVIRTMRMVLEFDPFDLEALKLACQAYKAEHKLNALKTFYATQRKKLLEVGETLPQAWQEFLG